MRNNGKYLTNCEIQNSNKLTKHEVSRIINFNHKSKLYNTSNILYNCFFFKAL